MIDGEVLLVPGNSQRQLPYTILSIGEANEDCKNPLNIAEFWWKIELRRNLKPFMIQTYLPTTLIVLVSWITFLIPFDSYPGRAGLLAGLFLCLINILLSVLSNSPNEGGINNLAAWLVICIFMVGIAFLEYFLVLFCMRYRKKQVAQMNKNISEIRKGEGDDNGNEKRQVNDIIDFYSLMSVPIIFAITFIVYFLVCVKFDSPDPAVVLEAKTRFEAMCSNLW